MSQPETTVTGFPLRLPEPSSYYIGIEAPERPRANNLIVFLRTNRETLQQKNFYNRSHHRNVLILVLDTAGSVIIDGAEHTLSPGQAYYVKPFQFHHYLNLQSDDLRWLFFTFDLERGEDQLERLSHSVLQPGQEELELWRKIADCAQCTTPVAQREALPLLDALLYRLTSGRRISAQDAPQSSWIAQAESLIVQSVDEGWTLEEVGRKLGLSDRQLRSRFQEEMGITIREYRANYQLHRAINLLRDSNNSMGRIAELCGFNSQAVFNRFIKRTTGQSPLAMRKQL